LGVVVAGSVALLLIFTGVSLADETGEIETNGASATVYVGALGFGDGAEIYVSGVEVTGSGCYYVKYDLKVQQGRDQNGKHVGEDFCYGEGNTERYVDVTSRLGLVPWVEGATVRLCENVQGTDPCGAPVYLEAWGHNNFRP
jgi:hypothetical protein